MRISSISFNIVLACLMLLVAACDAGNKQPTQSSIGDHDKALFNSDIKDARVLVFSKTKGWRHDSIPAGIAALQKIAQENKFTIVATEDSELFTDAQLSTYNAIVFLNTTLDVLDDTQQLAMERFIQAGGGFVGIHSAADTEWEGDWVWYRRLVGAVFKSHPNQPSNVQLARVDVRDKNHLATESLPSSFEIADEWYNYRDFYEFNHVLMTVDEKTYRGGEHGIYHPITWYHDFDGGRSFYTGLGHTAETYTNSEFLKMLLGGLRYAVGGKPKLDYAKAEPEYNRFIKKTLVDHLDEPVNLTFFANGDTLIAERGGAIKRVDYKTGETTEIGKLVVDPHGAIEFGLLGLAVDPNFDKTHLIYASYNLEKEPGKSFERLARFKLENGKVNLDSQEVMFEFAIDQNCCHTGGDLEFGKNGELFFSTGDNSSPFTENGYAPIDFRADPKSDALRSAGNTQDLRGKVLRIIPKAAGGYDIPAGNLFADAKDGRPEIYVMGTRNAYKITYDKHSSTLFYGDVGPDAGEDSDLKGARGYDEINRVTKAGNFGWPLFVGNNFAYKEYDYATDKTGQYFNPLAPINNSPRNTGLKELPPAQPALIWYPYGPSDEFPELGKGGRMALVADVYHAEDYPESVHRYPSYFNNKLIILDFMRNWIKAVSFTDEGRIIKIEPLAPQIGYVSPIDARFGPDGTLYVLEYGKAWFKGNPEAALSRIEYVGAGNRPPVAQITLDKPQGGLPYKAVADAQQSFDLDGDKLTYNWSLKSKEGKVTFLGTNVQQSVEISVAGEYTLILEAKDPAGATAKAEVPVQVGNEPAQIDIKLDANQSFYWPTSKNIKYAVSISDKEDGVVGNDLKNVDIAFAAAADTSVVAQGHQKADLATQAKGLMAANGCKACHSFTEKIVGPAFNDVAARYKSDKNALNYLTNKIKKGGNGAWGNDVSMPSFATLTDEERNTLATYVLSLADEKKTLPLQGAVSLINNPLDQMAFDASGEPDNIPNQKFELTASYIDQGGVEIGPIKVTKTLTLTPARLALITMFDAKTNKKMEKSKQGHHDTVKVPASGEWLVLPLGQFDLTGISNIKIGAWVTKVNTPWQYELRTANGSVLAKGDNLATALNAYSRTTLKVDQKNSYETLSLAIHSNEKSASELQLLDISFHQ